MSVEPCRELTIAGRYRLEEEIGRGGVGMVWRAHSLALDIPCAIKFLLPQHAQDAAQRARFLHEARAAAALRSPHTVLVFDVDQWEGLPFIAMELLNGENLEQCLKRRGVLSPQLTCEIVRQVALGLSKAHAAGLVHRDLKPENVFLVHEDGVMSVKILDFGIAKRVHAPLDFRTLTGTLIGTPYYMSPEQSKGSKDVDFRSDLWSLAVLAYRCLTGRLPFEGESLTEILLKIVHGPLPSPCAANPALPRSLDAWWRSAADRDPGGRPTSASALAKGLQQALFGAGAVPGAIPEHMTSGTRQRPSLPEPPGNTTQRSTRRRWLPWLVTAAAALGLLGAGYAVWRGRAARPTPAEHRVLPSKRAAATARVPQAAPPVAVDSPAPAEAVSPTAPSAPSGTVPPAAAAQQAPAGAVGAGDPPPPTPGVRSAPAPAQEASQSVPPPGEGAPNLAAPAASTPARVPPAARANRPAPPPPARKPVVEVDDRLGF